MKIEISDEKFGVDNDIVQKAIKKTLQKLQKIGKLVIGQDIRISVAVVNREEIKKINKKWRNKNEETDVLSFCYENTKEKLEGEIILCGEIIKCNAEKDKIEMKEELAKNVIHSILHISGYEHNEEMFSLQNKILNKV